MQAGWWLHSAFGTPAVPDDGLPHFLFLFLDKKTPGASGRFSEDQVASPARSFGLLHFCLRLGILLHIRSLQEAPAPIVKCSRTTTLHPLTSPPRDHHLPAPPTRHPSHQRTNQEHNRHDTICHPPSTLRPAPPSRPAPTRQRPVRRQRIAPVK